jgi:hypothetical protein
LQPHRENQNNDLRPGWKPCPFKAKADVAQLVEHSLGKGEVISSILIIGSRVREVDGKDTTLVVPI